MFGKRTTSEPVFGGSPARPAPERDSRHVATLAQLGRVLKHARPPAAHGIRRDALNRLRPRLNGNLKERTQFICHRGKTHQAGFQVCALFKGLQADLEGFVEGFGHRISPALRLSAASARS